MDAKAADFVFLSVSDLSEAVPFYRDTVGLALEVLSEETGWAEFALPPTTLALAEGDQEGPFTPGGGGGVAVAVDDVPGALEDLQDEGLPVLMEPEEWPSCEMAMTADPDGNPLVLHRRRDGTHGRVDSFD